MEISASIEASPKCEPQGNRPSKLGGGGSLPLLQASAEDDGRDVDTSTPAESA